MLERIAELDPLMTRMACLWSFRTSEDADELYSSFHFEITQQAILRPDFLDAKNNAHYIVTYGVRQTINNYRYRKSHDASTRAQSLDEDGMDECLDDSTLETCAPDAAAILAQLADTLDENGKAVLDLVRNLGSKAFKRNGTLNVNKIAALSGRPQRTLYRHINTLRSNARAMNLYR